MPRAWFDATAAIVVALAILACDEDVSPRVVDEAPPPPAATPSGATRAIVPDATRGRSLLEEHECHRCHEGTSLRALPQSKQCVGCHRAIVEGRFDAPADALADWKSRIVHLRHVPSLAGLGALLRNDWIASFLREPHDLRPNLDATMPRLDVTEEESEHMAAFLTRSAPTHRGVAVEGDVDRGATLFEDKECGKCHAFTGADASGVTQHQGDARTLAAGVLLAPDLAHTRSRVRATQLVPWLLHPQKLRPGSPMPETPLTDEEAQDLAAFVLRAPIADTTGTAKELPPVLSLLERTVTFEEVSQKVFKKVCWHCHAQPDFARGDGGPGMSGGFGYPARGLDMSSYESLAAGYLDDRGERASVFRRTEGGTPLLVRVMLARQEEEAGRRGAQRGMPLGLPAMSPEQIQLVASWIDQGRPR